MMDDQDDPGSRAALLHERAIVLRDAGSFAAAEALSQEAAALFEACEGGDSPNLANALLEQARLLELLDRFAEAAPACDRALSILRPLVDGFDGDPVIHEELIRLLIHAESVRASIHRAAGDLATAETGCRRAIALAETRLPPHDPLLADMLNGLGVVYKFQGRYADAEPLYRRALTIVEASGDDGARATLLHNLGGLAHARGDFAVGEPLARQSLEMREALLGADHPLTAADRAAWGALLEGLGRTAEAERAYADALAVFETRLGPHSLEAASALTALGAVQHARGASIEAEQSYRRALAIREAILGPRHFDLGLTMNNLAMLLIDRQANAEARVLLTHAQEIFAAELGPEHPHTRAVAANIATLPPAN